MSRSVLGPTLFRFLEMGEGPRRILRVSTFLAEYLISDRLVCLYTHEMVVIILSNKPHSEAYSETDLDTLSREPLKRCKSNIILLEMLLTHISSATFFFRDLYRNHTGTIW